MIKYCKRCVMPDTKPDLTFDSDGICTACRSYENRKSIDWKEREKEFIEILDGYKSNGTNYDCIVPVSGGKDSHYQVLKVLELGYNPLCVTATTCQLSDIGRKNIESLKKLGVDYIEITTNPIVRRKINRIALIEVGDISWPEHITIFTIPVRIAVQLNIPLIIWGENSQNEYGGPAVSRETNILNRKWLETFGGLLKLSNEDLIKKHGIKERDLIQYTYPSDNDLKRIGVTGIFMGYYFPWDGHQNALIAQAYGMHTLETAIEGSLVNYENLDNVQTGIHDYFKYLKYGFCRVTDLACSHIRRGSLTRKQAMKIVRDRDGKFPWTYLGFPIEKILCEIDMSLEEFVEICDLYTNKKLFKCDWEGSSNKDRQGNLEKINYDNEG